MSTLNSAKMPRLADKLEARERDIKEELSVELTAVTKAKKRAKKV